MLLLIGLDFGAYFKRHVLLIRIDFVKISLLKLLFKRLHKGVLFFRLALFVSLGWLIPTIFLFIIILRRGIDILTLDIIFIFLKIIELGSVLFAVLVLIRVLTTSMSAASFLFPFNLAILSLLT